MSFIAELKRRNVFKVAAAYVVVSWLVMQISDTLGDALELSAPMGKYIFVALVAGFPLALFLAWAYELTPEGVKKAEEVDKSESITHVTGQKINTIIMVFLVVAAGYFFWESRLADRAHDETTASTEPTPASVAEADDGTEAETAREVVNQQSIAVLPFVNMSSDEEQEYFSDGLSEELLNVLAHIPQLKVAARTSSFYFKGKDVKIADIARQLGVAHVLEGSVRKAGSTIRITAQLIRAADGFHLWSGTFDRKLDDVFVIQDEISRAIVDALQVKMGLGEEKPNLLQRGLEKTSSPEAHQAYLLGKHLLRQRTEQSIKDGIVQLQRAQQLDPDYASPMVSEAEGWLLLRSGAFAYGDLSVEEVKKKARPLLDRALQLQPDSSHLNAVKGLLLYEDNPELAMGFLEKAITLNPGNTEARLWLGNLLGGLNLFDELLAMRKESYVRDPLSRPTLSNMLTEMLYLQKDTEYPELLPKLMALSKEYGYRVEAFRFRLQGDYIAMLDNILKSNQQGEILTNWKTSVLDLSNFGLLGGLEDIPRDSWQLDYLLDMVTGNYDAGIELLENRMLANPDVYLRSLLAKAYLAQEDWSRAYAVYQGVWESQSENTRPERDFSVWELQAFALAADQAGHQDMAEQMKKISADLVDLYTSKGVHQRYTSYWKMDQALLNRDYPRAIAWMAELNAMAWHGKADVVIGNVYMPVLHTLKVFEELHQNPAYQAEMAKVKATAEKVRHEFLVITCGDNPYRGLWEPSGEQCREVTP